MKNERDRKDKKEFTGERSRERKGDSFYIVFLLYIIKGMGLKIKSFQQALGQHSHQAKLLLHPSVKS